MEFTCDANEKFDWDFFMRSRKVEPVPNFAFQHVDRSQQSLVEEGMDVEVQHASLPQPKYWFATITMKCGPFLRLKYLGQEDSKELWADPSSMQIQPIGYCLSHDLILEPPQDIQLGGDQNAQVFIKSMLDKHQAANCNASLLSPMQQMKPGLSLEVEDLNESRTVWPGTVERNIGGRLLIRYELPNQVPQNEATELWLFCLSPRLHSRGWASQQEHSWEYKPPKKIRPLFGEEKWLEMAQKYRSSLVNESPWIFSEKLETHSFLVDKRLSALAPWDPTSLKASTVVNVVDNHRFTIRFDSANEEGETLCCFAGEGRVFECQDDQAENEFVLREENNCKELGFEPSTVLEVVNPWKPDEIWVGTIVDTKATLLKVRLEKGDENASSREFFLPFNSFDIFPVGWCESHGHPLHGPSRGSSQSELCEQHESALTCAADFVTEAETLPTSGVSYWCPKIYFNFRCISGPLLSKLRIAALPRSVGPGPILLVLKEVLSLLINGAYKPGSVLKQLQGEPGAPLPKGTQLEPLKAKYKQTTYRGSIPIASTAADVPDYCKWVCEKLQCCTHLFGPDLVGDPCPRKCSATMTKSNWHHKKRSAKSNGRNKRLEASKNTSCEPMPSVSDECQNTLQSKSSTDLIENSDESNDPNHAELMCDLNVTNVDRTSGSTDSQQIWTHRTGGDERQVESDPGNIAQQRLTFDDSSMKHSRDDIDKLDESNKKKRGRPKKSAKISHLSGELTPDECKMEEHIKSTCASPFLPSIPLISQVSRWTVEQVVDFLTKIGVPRKCLDRFKDEEIDGEALLCLSSGDLMELLQMRFVPVVKIMNALLLLKEKS